MERLDYYRKLPREVGNLILGLQETILKSVGDTASVLENVRTFPGVDDRLRYLTLRKLAGINPEADDSSTSLLRELGEGIKAPLNNSSEMFSVINR
jgi:hypothetical protein